RRTSRDVNSPAPVDCQLSQWSEWTDCFFCQEKKYRHRTLQQPAQFGGRPCSGQLWDEEHCGAGGSCARSTHCGKDFQCPESGRCLKRHLVCNGEADCKDWSDEENCEEEEDDNKSYCGNLFPVPGAEKASLGYNILTQEDRLHVYDPHFFGGQCEYVYNGEWRELKYDPECERLYYGDDEKYFRKPYNFHVYQFLAHADSGFSTEFYNDSKDLLDALKTDRSETNGFTFGIGPQFLKLELGFTLSHQKGSLKNFTQYDAKEVGFIRGVTKVQTARFKMRKENIVLDEDILLSLEELPDDYDYGMYAKFINDYGTHFMTSGTMGGVFEYILVVNKEEMRRRDISSEDVASCFGASLGIVAVKSELNLKASLSTSECKNKGFFRNASSNRVNFSDGWSNSAIVEDIIPRIRGGDTSYSGGLLNTLDSNTYRRWGRSLKYNPAVIDFELQPIHEILRGSEAAGAKRQHLRRALHGYVSEFSACRCGPCRNDGEPVLAGDTCVCHCLPGYGGPACAQSRRPARATNGRWSCWSPWSPCQAGRRRRSRQCNNPAPGPGGAACAGPSARTEPC
ncbi:CO8A protein, partial [Nothoprocta ornata]|nr:CO8A protein [Nothoprocta ornata]